jgi:hypothetical protein
MYRLYVPFVCTICLSFQCLRLCILLLLAAVEFSIGGSSPYTSTEKTKNNTHIRKETIKITNPVNTSIHITRTPTHYESIHTLTHTLQNPHIYTPTHYKTHTYTHPHITKPTQYKTHTYTHPHIKKPTQYKTHTYTHPHITQPTHTNTHTIQKKLKQLQYRLQQPQRPHSGDFVDTKIGYLPNKIPSSHY